jgi:hypothetical protein
MAGKIGRRRRKRRRKIKRIVKTERERMTGWAKFLAKAPMATSEHYPNNMRSSEDIKKMIPIWKDDDNIILWANMREWERGKNIGRRDVAT